MRIEPLASPYAYKTYQAKAPLDTHWTAATCAQVECEHYVNGWGVHVEAVGPELEHLARTSGRRYHEAQAGPGQTWLLFEPGQPCFEAGTHLRRLEREELFVLRDGDWRGNPTGRTATLTTQTWLDDFGEHQDRLTLLIEKG